MPTIGQPGFAAAGFGLAFVLGDFDCDTFLPLVFVREEAALDIAFRFPAMRALYVRCACACTQAAIMSGGTRCPQRVVQATAALP